VKTKILFLIISIVLVLATLFPLTACKSAPTGPVSLDVVGPFARDHPIMKYADYFFTELETRGAGKVVVNYKGGSEVIPTFDQPEALIKGVLDVNAAILNYYPGVVPGAHVLELSTYPHTGQAPGTPVYDYMVDMFAEKGIRYIGEYGGGPDFGNFLLFTNKKPQNIGDLAGQKIRVSPLTRQFVEALGAEPITMPAGDIYLAMDRGTIDGFLFPIWGAFVQFGFPEVTKYCVNYPVYRGQIGMVQNLDSWKEMPKEVQNLMLEVSTDTVQFQHDFLFKAHNTQVEGAKAGGVEFIELPPADAQKYLQLSQDTLWEYFKGTVSSKRYTELRKLLGYE